MSAGVAAGIAAALLTVAGRARSARLAPAIVAALLAVAGRARSARLAPAIVAALLAVAGLPGTAGAHDFNPGVLSLAEREPGRFDLAWSAPVDSAGSPAGVEPVFPASCRRDGARLDCGEAGLSGPIWFTGMDLRRMVVVVVVRWRGGERHEHLVSGAEPAVAIRPPARPGLAASARALAGHAAALALALALFGALRRARAGPGEPAAGPRPAEPPPGPPRPAEPIPGPPRPALASAPGVPLGAFAARRPALASAPVVPLGAFAARRPALAGAPGVPLGALAARRPALAGVLGVSLGALAAHLASAGPGAVGALAAWAPIEPLAAAGAVLLARAALTGRGLGRAPAVTAIGFGLVIGAASPWPLALAAALAAGWTGRRAPSVLDRDGRAARLDRRMNQLAGALGAAALVQRALALAAG